MSVRHLPDRPNLDQLKRQAKELLEAWRRGDTTDRPSHHASFQLRDAQRAVARQYGFDSWNALRAHVEAASGTSTHASRSRREVLDYKDPVPGAVPLSERLTVDVVRRLMDQGVSAVKVGPQVPAESLARLAVMPALLGIDLGGRRDLRDDDLAFLEKMPWLTALSLSGCGQITDVAVERLRTHARLERVNLQWTETGDAAITALRGKPSLSRVLVGDRLTDAGAAHLRDYPALAVSGARDAFLAVSSARRLTDAALAAIGSLDGVIALDAHMSAFGSPLYTVRGVAHLRSMASLQELNFHGALATDEVLAALAEIPRLRWLHCQDPVSSDDGFVALGRCTTLEHLGSRVCGHMTGRGFAAIAGLPRLRHLAVGGPRVPDSAMAALTQSPTLVDLHPIKFGDASFEHIAKIPRLERLTNMYNRSTGDAATRHLRAHPTLVYYGAFGTQITDETLRILAELPRLETAEFANCDAITDDGLRALVRLPRLCHVSDGSCPRVTGAWVRAMPPVVTARHDGSSAAYVDAYRAETLIDYPDVAVPVDAPTPTGHRSDNTGELSPVMCFGLTAAYADEGLRLEVVPGIDPRRTIGLVTREVFAVPCRLQLVVKPVSVLRLIFGAHNRQVVLDDHGRVVDRTPWFMVSPAQRGEAVEGDASFIDEDWVRVTVELETNECRLYVNRELRHVWHEDQTAVRSRVGIGAPQSAMTIRELSVERIGL